MATPAIETTRAAWDAIAPGYDRTNTTTQMWLGNEGLRRAGLRAGMRFLDVASGSGALSIPAARLGAEVLAIDLSPVMLRLLQQRASAEGLSVETQVMDGHALRLEDDSFDLAGSQFGVMVFPDMPRGIAELARVVRPGGRVLVTAYGDPHQIDFLGFFVAAVQSVRPEFHGPPVDPPPLPLQLSNPNRLRAELTSAGLTNVTVETITESTAFVTGLDLWEWVLWSNPIVESFLEPLALSPAERAALPGAMETLVRDRAGSDGVAHLTNPVHIGIGDK